MKLIECLTWDLVGVLLLHVFHLNGPNPGFYSQMLNLELISEGTFLIVGGEGGKGPRASWVGSLVNVLQIGEGQICFNCSSFLEGKNYSMSLS